MKEQGCLSTGGCPVVAAANESAHSGYLVVLSSQTFGLVCQTGIIVVCNHSQWGAQCRVSGASASASSLHIHWLFAYLVAAACWAGAAGRPQSPVLVSCRCSVASWPSWWRWRRLWWWWRGQGTGSNPPTTTHRGALLFFVGVAGPPLRPRTWFVGRRTQPGSLYVCVRRCEERWGVVVGRAAGCFGGKGVCIFFARLTSHSHPTLQFAERTLPKATKQPLFLFSFPSSSFFLLTFVVRQAGWLGGLLSW